jgi:hypothetical protein
MPEPPTNPEAVVYQLRVVLRGVSPLIWRCLLVRSDSTIADLHATFQLALGWSDEHLNRFVIHGRECRVWHDGGTGFRQSLLSVLVGPEQVDNTAQADAVARGGRSASGSLPRIIR